MKGAILVTLAVVMSLGCKGRIRGPAVAPAPRVAVTAEPVSVPQTAVQLPPAQPVPAEAVPPEPEPKPPPAAVKAPPPSQSKPEVRPRPPAAVVSRPAPEPEPPPVTQSAPAPPLRPVLSRQQEQDLQSRISRSVAAAQKSLAQAGHADRQAAERVKAFLEQAQQARRQGDLIRARSLAERAEWLAADLIRSTK